MSVICSNCDEVISDVDSEEIVEDDDTEEVYMRKFEVESTDAYTLTGTAYYCNLDCLIEDQRGDSA